MSETLGQGYTEETQNIEKWMSEWMSLQRAAKGALDLRRFSDPMYILLNKLYWSSDKEVNALPDVTAPKGFVSDLASVPRIFWSIFRPDGKYAYAAIIHDWLYWEQVVSREDADRIFLEAMEEFDVKGSKTVFNAVRLGGGAAWKNNAKLREEGERRVLVKFPQNPKVTWNDWKQEEGVFGDI